MGSQISSGFGEANDPSFARVEYAAKQVQAWVIMRYYEFADVDSEVLKSWLICLMGVL